MLVLDNCRIPKDNILGSPEVNTEKGFAGVMQTFDNTRPIVAGMAVGLGRAVLEELRTILKEAGVEVSYDVPANNQHAAAAEFLALEADWEAAYLLALRATWMADNKKPNSLEASVSKAKAGRTGTAVSLKAVELAGTYGTRSGPCSRSGHVIPRSSTSSRAPSRSSSSSSLDGCSESRPPN